ncbi:MAG: ComEC/Rec2 family competence protein [Candidatus Gracilibacteria bacterium]|nr:ComEC/Rec2 family competence protein [Candidatus Gracilibacteria bacterium]
MTDKNLQARKNLINIYLSACFSFLSAVLLTNIYEHGFVYVFLLSFLISLGILLYYRQLYFLLIFSLSGMLFGYYISLSNIENIYSSEILLSDMTSGFSKTVEINGRIGGIEGTDEERQYIFNIRKIDSRILDKDIDIILKTGSNLKFQKGDIISADMKISEIRNTGEFDYKAYLRMKGIFGQGTLYKYIKAGQEISSFGKAIEMIRSEFLNMIEKIYPSPYSGLLSGILIGEKGGLPKELKTDFNRSGLSHIIAVSGFNITIMIIFLSFFVKYLPGYMRFLIIGFFIVSFYLIVGENIPALRASIMGIISYLAIMNTRKLENFNMLMAVIVVFILINPMMMNYDLSFHLSFLATLGVMYTQGFFKRIYTKVPEFLSIKESLIMTSSALIFTIPIMLVNFGQLSIISPLSNILVAPAIPLSMLFGFLSVLFYMISIKIGIALGFIGWLFLKFMVSVATLSSGTRFSILEINMQEYGYMFEIAYYVLLVFMILYYKEEKLA